MGEINIENYNLNFGPQHPAAHGVLRLVLELDGEIIERADPHIGLLHRGTEKLIEYKTYHQSIPYFDRMDYMAMLCQEHPFVLAAERLLDVEVPVRGQWLRVLWSEFTRLMNHIGNTMFFAMDVGALSPILYGTEIREKGFELQEALCGARMHAAWFRIGGVHKDMPEGLEQEMKDWLVDFEDCLQIFESLLNENRIFKQRSVDIGIVSKEDAIAWGFTGPMLRGSGVAWDLRKSQPYETYSEIDFDIPVGKNGDVYDRYFVRIAEMRESIKIIHQCFDKMPEGPVLSDDHRVAPPRRVEMKESMEALIRHFKLYTQGIVPPEGEVYAAVEAPKGETGVYLISDGTNKPYRCKVRPPSYVHLSAFDAMCRGTMLADSVSILGGMDIVFGEIDR